MINAIIGLLSGACASMGLGGGFVLMIYLLNFTDTNQLNAQGINLIFFLPIALVSILIHRKNKLINWRTIPLWCGFGVLGIALGTFAAQWLDTTLLNKLFAVLLLIIGVKEIFHKEKKFEKGIDKFEKV